MNNSFSLLFYIKKSKADSSGRANIYLKITMDGQRAELSIRRKVLIDKWNSDMNMARGSSDESLEINRYISTNCIPLSNDVYLKVNLSPQSYFVICI